MNALLAHDKAQFEHFVLAASCGCWGKDAILHILLVVVVVQTTHADALTVALPLASHVAILAAVMGLDGETTVGPKLALSSETVGCLQQCHQQGSGLSV